MAIESFLNQLQKVKRRGAGKWSACCPVHDDKTPSLALSDDNGTILIHCFGCGASGSDVAGALGLDISELFPPRDYSQYTADDYAREAKRRTYFSASQILEALQFDTLVTYMIADDMSKNGIDDQTKARLLVSIERIQAASNYIKQTTK